MKSKIQDLELKFFILLVKADKILSRKSENLFVNKRTQKVFLKDSIAIPLITHIANVIFPHI